MSVAPGVLSGGEATLCEHAAATDVHERRHFSEREPSRRTQLGSVRRALGPLGERGIADEQSGTGAAEHGPRSRPA